MKKCQLLLMKWREKLLRGLPNDIEATVPLLRKKFEGLSVQDLLEEDIEIFMNEDTKFLKLIASSYSHHT